MNNNFQSQQSQLLSIKQEISLLQHQINYLLRTGKAVGLLDLDVLMNRTHTIYDQLCAINIAEPEDEEDFVDPDAMAELFAGIMPKAEDNVASEDVVPESAPAEETETVVEESPVETHEEIAPETEATEQVEEAPKGHETVGEDVENQSVDEPKNEEEPKAEETPLGDEYGFFFRFEEVPETEEVEEPSTDEIVERDGKLVHIMEEIPEEEIPERDLVGGDELVTDNPLEMPKMDDEIIETEEIAPISEPESDPVPEPEPESEPKPEPEPEPEVPSGGLSGYFDNDDTEFELASPETLGERMMQEDHSLAAKLQQNPVRDLRLAIGVNDKFLFVNELFGGSMEKYNKSIENLNDLKTLNGAMIYLNELKIELQWNSSNEAYQKLAELVKRKFESA